jgi:hypothetical protein
MFLSSSDAEDDNIETSEESTEWNSDEDVEEQDMADHCYLEDSKKSVVEKKLKWNVKILGFHPYKEILFLSASEQAGLAYRLNSSKIEDLGNIHPKDYVFFKQLSNEQARIKSFPYTPCLIEEFPGNS